MKDKTIITWKKWSWKSLLNFVPADNPYTITLHRKLYTAWTNYNSPKHDTAGKIFIKAREMRYISN